MTQQIRFHGEHRIRAKPKWVIMGVERNDGTVMLLASDQLSYAELEAKVGVDGLEYLYQPRLQSVPNTVYEMHGQLESIVMAYGNTWMDAFVKLFGLWEPKEPARPQLPAHADEML